MEFILLICILLFILLRPIERRLPEYEIDVLLTRLVRLTNVAEREHLSDEMIEAVTDTYTAVEQLARRMRQ